MMETGKLCQVESGYNRHLEAGKCSQYWTNKKNNEHDVFFRAAQYTRDSHAIRDWRASEYAGGCLSLQVEAVAVFADLFMPDFQEYGVALYRVLCGESRRISPIIGSGSGKSNV